MRTEIEIPTALAETLRSALESKVVMDEATEKQKEALEELEEIMGEDLTISTSIENGVFVLTDLVREDGTQYGQAWLTIYEDESCKKEIDYWDNTSYIIDFVKDVESGNESERIAEVKKLCEDFNIDYGEFCLSLQQLYRKGVKLKMIKP